jgi:HD-GYP domain-containing protein (c-di-GMP phosphodiesterase class II)
VAVADVFTALTEDRPYRAGMTRPQAAGVLGAMAGRRALDPALVAMLLDNYDEADAVRVQAQELARKDFLAFSAPRP